MSQLNSSATEIYHLKMRRAKASDTAARSLIFAKLYESGHNPLTMAELLDKTNGYVDRASVYRTVKLFEEIGIVRRLHIGWKYKLELSDDFHGHHHHLTCSNCGTTVAARHDEEFDKMLSDFAAGYGYRISEHQLDIRGLCRNCQKQA